MRRGNEHSEPNSLLGQGRCWNPGQYNVCVARVQGPQNTPLTFTVANVWSQAEDRQPSPQAAPLQAGSLAPEQHPPKQEALGVTVTWHRQTFTADQVNFLPQVLAKGSSAEDCKAV
jgi:hypothetical protein